jgi:putative RNA 2'-phosphotransferase
MEHMMFTRGEVKPMSGIAECREKVSRYASYLLRHNPENLKMDLEGFVDIDELLTKIRARYPVEKTLILDIVEKSERRRFEVRGNRIRALYGHTIAVKVELKEDRNVKSLYHGTTRDAASKILKEGLKPIKRKQVHLSLTAETAKEVGRRRTKNPVVLKIDAETAMRDGLRFYRATDKVYVSGPIPLTYIRRVRE